MLRSNLLLFITASVNAVVPTSVILCIFLMYANGSSTSSSSSMPLRWFCNHLKSARQTRTSSQNHLSLLALVNYMIIVTCLRTAVVFDHRVYHITLMAPLTLSNLSTPYTFPILSTPLTVPILCSPTHGTKECNIMVLMHLRGLNLRCRL